MQPVVSILPQAKLVKRACHEKIFVTRRQVLVLPLCGVRMTAQSDPAVRLETVAVAAGLALFSCRRFVAAGKIPQSDLTLSGTAKPIRAWRLSTIRSWNPGVADRCAAIVRALEQFPKDAA